MLHCYIEGVVFKKTNVFDDIMIEICYKINVDISKGYRVLNIGTNYLIQSMSKRKQYYHITLANSFSKCSFIQVYIYFFNVPFKPTNVLFRKL